MDTDTIRKYTRKIADSNPTQIIAVVYELTENYLDEALTAYNNADYEAFSTGINRASKCINDLINALDMRYDISGQLMSIYMFFNKELALASVKRDSETVIRIKSMVTKLKESFIELSEKDTSEAVMENAQGVYAGITYGRGTLNENVDIQSNRGFTV